jgi:pantetheine-phosphate adenylyltransferase
VYQAYARGIRAEYAHVPEQRYNSQRAQILAHLRGKAEAGILFADPFFTDHYTAAAIANMSGELALIAQR